MKNPFKKKKKEVELVTEVDKHIYCFIQIVLQLKALDNSTIAVLIHYDNSYKTFHEKLFKILEAEGYQPMFKQIPGIKDPTASRRIIFKNDTNQIKIWSLKTIEKTHPKDLVTSEKDWGNVLITNLEGMPPEFYKENITIGNCNEVLDKYKSYIKNY